MTEKKCLSESFGTVPRDCYCTAVGQLPLMKAMFQGKKNPVKTRPYDLRAEVPAKVGIAECVIDVIASVEGFIHGHFQKEGGVSILENSGGY